MKKVLIALLSCLVLTLSGFADCNCNNKPDCGCNSASTCKKIEKCSKCVDEDDEYCVYNQCFLDKHFIKMKKALCLTRQQEATINVIYKNFKADLESFHTKYRTEKNKLLTMIDCENDCYKEQERIIKEMNKEVKQKAKCFREDVKDQLCKNQYSDFRKFQRREKRKLKKIIKYAKVYKLPCSNCCND